MDIWEAIKQAYAMINSKVVARVDGEGFKAYRVGNTIRIDMEDNPQ